MITDIILAILGFPSKLLAALGVRTPAVIFHEVFSDLWTSDIKSQVQHYISLFFYFFPKELVITVLGVFVTVLVVRIVLAIIAEVWLG